MFVDDKHIYGREEMAGLPGGGPDFSDMECSHENRPGKHTVTIFGQILQLTVPDNCPLCRDCLVAWLVKYSTTCACCGGLILPYEKVAERPVEGNPFGLVHYSKRCAYYADNWCGVWGQGRLISIHELHPQIFPEGIRRAEGLYHALNGRCLMGLTDFK